MRSINPATGETVWEGKEATPKEIESAFTLASTSWRDLSIDERYVILQRYQEKLLENRERLAETISKEVGKPLWEAKTEVDAMAGKVPISYQAYLERCPTVVSGISARRHKPRGTVAVFGPFNFPGHLPNGHIVPALLAGNVVLFKPSELAPLVAIEICRCFQEAGLPKGVLSLLLGGKEVGQAIVNHPKLDGLFFTGSVDTGLILLKATEAHPEKILALEMGGNNPLVVGSIDDLKAAAYIALQSAYLTSGQRCTAARRLIVLREKQALIPYLVEMARNVRIGAYCETPEPFMGPLISEEAAKKVLAAQERWIKRGAKPLLLSEKGRANSGFVSCGLINTTGIALEDEELFGPLLQVIYVDSLDEAIDAANATRYGLSASILTDSDEEYQRFYQRSRAGVINRNCPTNGALSTNPFGGTGLSGNGRPSAYYAADYCSYPVASLEMAKISLPPTLLPGVSL